MMPTAVRDQRPFELFAQPLESADTSPAKTPTVLPCRIQSVACALMPGCETAAPESAISLIRPSTERRGRTTGVTSTGPAQNGTSRRDPPVGPPVVNPMVRAHRSRPVDLVGIGLLDR
jgi:hypothetical protein